MPPCALAGGKLAAPQAGTKAEVGIGAEPGGSGPLAASQVAAPLVRHAGSVMYFEDQASVGLHVLPAKGSNTISRGFTRCRCLHLETRVLQTVILCFNRPLHPSLFCHRPPHPAT